MAYDFFRFKEFTVHQDQSAMKVCTDACLFGAWVAFSCSPSRVLDIGTGTGLLSLMIAQRSAAEIHAVEIDADAARQAAENFAGSPWSERLHIYHERIQEHRGVLYDLIISNPPFYSGDLEGPDSRKNLAHHSSALTLEELCTAAMRMLSPAGLFAVLLPYRRAAEFENIAGRHQLSLEKKVSVKQTPRHPDFRVMYIYSKANEAVGTDETVITIKGNDNRYTDDFRRLLKEYYYADI